jgi:hypothetical protein
MIQVQLKIEDMAHDNFPIITYSFKDISSIAENKLRDIIIKLIEQIKNQSRESIIEALGELQQQYLLESGLITEDLIYDGYWHKRTGYSTIDGKCYKFYCPATRIITLTRFEEGE